MQKLINQIYQSDTRRLSHGPDSILFVEITTGYAPVESSLPKRGFGIQMQGSFHHWPFHFLSASHTNVHLWLPSCAHIGDRPQHFAPQAHRRSQHANPVVNNKQFTVVSILIMQFEIVALKNCFDACSGLDGVWIELLHVHGHTPHNSTSPKCDIRCESSCPVTYTNVYPVPWSQLFLSVHFKWVPAILFNYWQPRSNLVYFLVSNWQWHDLGRLFCLSVY